MFRYDAQAALREINVPLLVISGNHDRITKPGASDQINELATHSQSLRNDGGHLALFEFHEEVMQGIEQFVEQHQSIPRIDSVARSEDSNQHSRSSVQASLPVILFPFSLSIES